MLFSQAIHGFYLYQLTGNFSPITAQNYKRFLTAVDDHLDHPALADITTEALRGFLVHLREHGRSESTLQVYWKVVRSFYNWAAPELGIERPDLVIRSPVAVHREIHPYSQAEIQALVKACKSRRDKALVLVLLDTGVRVSECARLTLRDVELETGLVTVRPFATGKKSQPRAVRIGAGARRALWSYLAARRPTPVAADPLISTLANRPLNRISITNILRRIARRAQVPGVHPHRFRHTFAIEFLRNGGNVFELKELLGHRDLKTCQIYLRISQADLETAHRKASPVDHWKLS